MIEPLNHSKQFARTDTHLSIVHKRHTKPERLVEKASKAPLEVISEIFTHLYIMDLQGDLLPNWLRIANMNNKGAYTNAEERAVLHEFYDNLNLLIEALLVLTEKDSLTKYEKVSVYQLKEQIPVYNRPILLSDDQFLKPSAVVLLFFQQFPIDYVRRELWDLLDAAISFEGNFNKDFSPWMAFFTYDNVLCLIEAAYQLCIMDCHC